MEIILFVNNITGKIFKLIFVLLMIINSSLIYSFALSSLNVYQTDYHEINNQALNPVTESASIKINIKPLAESFTDKFCSYEYCIKALAQLPKIFIIISETDSEINIRQLTFLYTQTSTST